MLNPYRFHSQPQQLMGYADAFTKIPSIAWDLARTSRQKRKLEHVWAQDPELALQYAEFVIKKPWPPGEAAIASSARSAFQYAQGVIDKPWPPGEAAIASSAEYAYNYARYVIRKPWPPGEAAIASSAKYAYYYALTVIQKPWPPGEAAIASSAEYANNYARDVIGKRYPPGVAEGLSENAQDLHIGDPVMKTVSEHRVKRQAKMLNSR
jgi:lambda repressor-like predicted transcriptional regulator